jgi:hypothetical protein
MHRNVDNTIESIYCRKKKYRYHPFWVAQTI